MPSNVLLLHMKQTFPSIIWIFTEGEGDVIKSRLPFKIFSALHIMNILFRASGSGYNMGGRNRLNQSFDFQNYWAEMSLGLQIQRRGGHNLRPLVGIGLIELSPSANDITVGFWMGKCSPCSHNDFHRPWLIKEPKYLTKIYESWLFSTKFVICFDLVESVFP